MKDQVLIYTKQDLEPILGKLLKPRFFIEDVQFKINDISNMCIIELIKNLVFSEEFKKRHKIKTIDYRW